MTFFVYSDGLKDSSEGLEKKMDAQGSDTASLKTPQKQSECQENNY